MDPKLLMGDIFLQDGARRRKNRRIGWGIVTALVFILWLIWFTVISFAAPAEPTPAQIVRNLERQFNFPVNGLMSVWLAECSGQAVGGSQCWNSEIERGAFQMTRVAAEMWYVGCDWSRLGKLGQFAYEATCAAKYLAHWAEVCRTFQRAQGAYNRGTCSDSTRYTKRVLAHARRLAGG